MKIKVTVIVTKEFEINREYYPAEWTVDQILEQEINYSSDLFYEWLDGACDYEHKGEIIDED